MEDRVADVLVERAGIDNGAMAGLILSLLLHGGLTGLAVYAAMHAEAPKMANVLNIKFAPMPRSAGVVSPAVAKPAAAKPKPVAPKIEPPRPEPVRPANTKAPAEKNTVPISPFGKSAKKGSENPVIPPRPAPSPPQGVPGVAGVADVAVGSAGVTGLEGGDFPYTIYIEKMKTLIGTHWLRPQVTSATTTIYFAIDRDGTIRDTRVEQSSGNSFFDRAALRSVLETSPLPPLPFGYNGTYLGVHLTFR